MRNSIRRIVPPLIGFALLVTACGGDVAATVNGEPIKDAEVLAIRTTYGDGATVLGENFRSDLTNIILGELLVQAARADFGLADIDSQQSIDAFLADPGDDATIVDQLRNAEGFTDTAVRRQATLLLVRREVSAKLISGDPDVLASLFEDQPAEITKVCVRHILVATEGEAQDVVDRLAAGEDFATIADAISLDATSSGGVLPCPLTASQYVEPFASATVVAPLGEVFGPVETQYGWHVIIVDQRTAPASVEELASDPLAFVSPAVISELFTQWLNTTITAADIEVDPRIGSWFPEGDGILPPPD